MKELLPDSSIQEIIDTVNKLVVAYQALTKTIMNISDKSKSIYILDKLVDLENKIVKQGDLIVSRLVDKNI